MGDAELAEKLYEAFGTCAPLSRDTELLPGFLEKYKVGLFLREPTFCDAAYEPSGFLAPHRFLLISSNARSLAALGLPFCIWQPGRIFKVIDTNADASYTQTTLLEIPEELVDFFCMAELSPLETSFVQQARETFRDARSMSPLSKLDTEEYKRRMRDPIGINDAGQYFPLTFDPLSAKKAKDPKTLGFDLSKVLNHQALVHLNTGDVVEAESLLAEAIRTEEACDPPDSTVLATSHYRLGELYFNRLDLRGAEVAFQTAFSYVQQLSTEANRPLVSSILHQLGQVYHQGGAFDYAERNYVHALKIARRVKGEQSPSVVSILTSLGALGEVRGDLEKSEAYLSEALDIAAEAPGKGSSEYGRALNNYARLAQVRGQFAEAEASFREALASELGRGGESAVEVVRLRYNLAELYAAAGQPARALEAMKSAMLSEDGFLRRTLAAGSERQRLIYSRQALFRVAQLLSLVLRDFRDAPMAVAFAADQIVARKGLVVESEAFTRELVLRGDGAFMRHGFQALDQLRADLGRRRLAGPGPEGAEAHRSRLARDAASIEKMEVALSLHISRAGYVGPLLSGACSQVARALPGGTALIEFIRFNGFDFKASRSEGDLGHRPARYAAFVLVPEAPDQPRMIDLGEAESIEKVLATFRSAITGERARPAHPGSEPQSGDGWREIDSGESALELGPRDPGRRLREVVFDPLLDALGGRRRLFISPDGDLHRLPFETLPLADDRFVIEEYLISYLSVGRDVLKFGRPASGRASAPLVFADPDYDLRDGGESHPGHSRGQSSPLSFTRLPGTLQEGEAIASLLGVAPRLGASALESSLKSSDSPAILHLATHGFFLADKPKPILMIEDLSVGMIVRDEDPLRRMLLLDGVLATPPTFVDSEREDSFVRLAGPDLSDPLLRSGVALAGANTWLNGGTLPAEADDGILNGQDILGLDLRDTELVVLSACETGLGEVRAGEGVFGLRRAFFLAGARTLVLSLWKVPDRQTQELMVDFYRRLISGEPRAEALRAAQLAVKLRDDRPGCWGAFICQGEPGPLLDLDWPARRES